MLSCGGGGLFFFFFFFVRSRRNLVPPQHAFLDDHRHTKPLTVVVVFGKFEYLFCQRRM